MHNEFLINNHNEILKNLHGTSMQSNVQMHASSKIGQKF